MFHQLLTRNTQTNRLEAEGAVKDPKNANSVALLLVAIMPAALPLLEARDPATLFTLVIPLVLAGLAVAMLIKGLAAETVWKDSDAALKPKYPFKIFGALTLGMTVAALILVHTSLGIVPAVTQGLIAAGLSALAFGIDPLKNKGLDTALDRDLLVLNPKLEALENRLEGIGAQMEATQEPLAIDASMRVAESIERLIRAIRLDPARHRIARRHFGVIFDGFERSSTQFSTVWATVQDKAALIDYLELSQQLAAEYNRAAEAYARGGTVNFGIESSVLKQLIKREAARAG